MCVGEFSPASHSARPEGRMETRPVLTLDWLSSQIFRDRLDWVKIDVEGAEVAVIKGGLDTIARCKPKLLIENHEGYRPGVRVEIDRLLLPLGYKETKNWQGDGINDNWSLWSAK